MNTNMKYSISGTIVAAITVIGLMTFTGFEVDAIIANENMPQQGIVEEREAKGIAYAENTYLIHITSGDPNNTHELNSALRGIQNAHALYNAGNEVIIYLDASATRIADVDHPNALSESHQALMAFLNDGGRVIACDFCEGSMYVENLLRGVEIDYVPIMPKLQRVLAQTDAVLDY